MIVGDREIDDKIVNALRRLCAGGFEPDDWIEWWQEHSEWLAEELKRGEFLRIKPPKPTSGGRTSTNSTFCSHGGACKQLDKWGLEYEMSDRYERANEEEFRAYCKDKDEWEREVKRQLKNLPPYRPQTPTDGFCLQQSTGDSERPYPTRMVGYNVRIRPGAVPEICGSCILHGLTVDAETWRDGEHIHVDDRRYSGCMFGSYRVRGPVCDELLVPDKSIFFAALDIPKLDCFKKVPQGNGELMPRWHKCHRAWPVYEREAFQFVGQFYYADTVAANTVAYVFSKIIDGREVFAIYHDDITRQDIEKHYREEEQRSRR